MSFELVNGDSKKRKPVCTATKKLYLNKLKYLIESGINFKNITDFDALFEKIKNLPQKKRGRKKIGVSAPNKDATGKNIDGFENLANFFKALIYLYRYPEEFKEFGIVNDEEIVAMRKNVSVLDHFSGIMKMTSATREKLNDDRIMTDNQLKNYVPWDKVRECFASLKAARNVDSIIHRDFVIVSVYYLFPPRRVMDYAFMHVTEREEDLSLDKNYFVINHGGKSFFVFRKYKNSECFGTQRIYVIDELAEIIKEYVKKYKISGSLFDIEYESFSNVLSGAFSDFCGKNVKPNILRHSYLGYLRMTKELDKTITFRKKVAYCMAHSLFLQEIYIKDASKKLTNDEKNRLLAEVKLSCENTIVDLWA